MGPFIPNSVTDIKAPQVNVDEPRLPPPPPTPLDFPCCQPSSREPSEADVSSDILKLFSNILRTGPALKHLEALNVDLEDNVKLEDLLPQLYLPPSEWTVDPKISTTSSSQHKAPSEETLSNGGPLPGHEIFYTRVRELLYANDDAFRTVQQKTLKAADSNIRVLHFRKFWDSLLQMSEYWDSSKDNYSKSTTTGTNSSENDRPSSAMDVDELAKEAQHPEAKPARTFHDTEEETYTGRRKDTGRNMPPKYREDTVFAFVEPLTWCFRCRLEHARMQPKVKIAGMVLPLPHNGNVYRTPENPRLARNGILEGPMAGLFVRDQLVFRRGEDGPGEGKQEILDLLRETGLGLMMAQKRGREGTEEKEPGDLEWWATKPRWGGGKGGEMGLSEDEAVLSSPVGGEEAGGSNNGNGQGQGQGQGQIQIGPPPGKRPKRVNNKAASWKEVKPPATTWERGVTYLRIGCESEGNHDDIYLFSALNHHISILHLRIPTLYIQHLGTHRRKLKFNPTQQSWYRIKMRRSRWYDLFSAEDRVEAMRGIWAVLGYLMRRGGPPDEATTKAEAGAQADEGKLQQPA